MFCMCYVFIVHVRSCRCSTCTSRLNTRFEREDDRVLPSVRSTTKLGYLMDASTEDFRLLNNKRKSLIGLFVACSTFLLQHSQASTLSRVFEFFRGLSSFFFLIALALELSFCIHFMRLSSPQGGLHIAYLCELQRTIC